jgi:hypothetical protein
MNMRGRSLLKETDLAAGEFIYLIEEAGQLRMVMVATAGDVA